MSLLHIREPRYEDEAVFLAMTQASRSFHTPWITAPLTTEEYFAYIQRYQQPSHQSYLVFHPNGDIVGVYNISEIVRGCFQSAYLGFYAASTYSHQGLMSKGLQLVLKEAFTTLGLHRLEANIQPTNIRSMSFIQKNRFRREGFSPRYLYINNQWCDHERWAITIEDWLQNSV